MSDVAAELRAQAHRVLAGWVRREPLHPGEACAVMWVDEVGRFRGLSIGAQYVVEDLLLDQDGGWPFDHLSLWNDAPPRSGGPVNRRQVAAVLRRAADRVEATDE